MISEETPRVVHQGSGSLGPFALSVDGTPITYSAPAEIRITRHYNDGTSAVLVNGTHYTLTDESILPDVGETDQPISAGSFTLEADQDVLAIDEYIEAERITVARQDLVLRTAGGFSSSSFERKLDEIVRLIQELRTKSDRTLTLHPLDDDGALALDRAADRADKLLGFDGSGALEFVDNTFTGPTGATGAAGANGTVWYTGTGAPSAGLGTTTDRYLNTSNGDVYTKASGSWVADGNIRGASGAGTGDMLKTRTFPVFQTTQRRAAISGLGLHLSLQRQRFFKSPTI